MDLTATIRRRYNRFSRVYGLAERLMNRGLSQPRAELLAKIQGPKVLEVGVGTGANLPFFSEQLEVTAIDFSIGMLRQAQDVADGLHRPIELLEMDVQQLRFEDNTFDSVITTCVFCSVPDPVLGLQEIHRVLKPSGQLLMIEHVASRRMWLRTLMTLMSPLVFALIGDCINRDTRKNLEQVGFSVEEQDLWSDILKVFVCQKVGSLWSP